MEQELTVNKKATSKKPAQDDGCPDGITQLKADCLVLYEEHKNEMTLHLSIAKRDTTGLMLAVVGTAMNHKTTIKRVCDELCEIAGIKDDVKKKRFFDSLRAAKSRWAHQQDREKTTEVSPSGDGDNKKSRAEARLKRELKHVLENMAFIPANDVCNIVRNHPGLNTNDLSMITEIAQKRLDKLSNVLKINHESEDTTLPLFASCDNVTL